MGIGRCGPEGAGVPDRGRCCVPPGSPGSRCTGRALSYTPLSTMKKPKKFFIAVAGNIGSGKSSLTRILSERFGWKPYFESVEDNPYLTDFYADMKRWSFNLQVYFLSNRFRSHKAITEGPDSVILDRAIYEDAEIF